jgi:hypothetical protein
MKKGSFKQLAVLWLFFQCLLCSVSKFIDLLYKIINDLVSLQYILSLVNPRFLLLKTCSILNHLDWVVAVPREIKGSRNSASLIEYHHLAALTLIFVSITYHISVLEFQFTKWFLETILIGTTPDLPGVVSQK